MKKRPPTCCEGCGRDTRSETGFCRSCRGDEPKKRRPVECIGLGLEPEEGDVPLVVDDDYHGEVYRDDV